MQKKNTLATKKKHKQQRKFRVGKEIGISMKQEHNAIHD